jgi:hypothetical protein
MRCSKCIFKMNKDNQKVKYCDPLIKICVKLCQSSKKYSTEGPEQFLIGIRDLRCSRARDGYAPVPRRGRAISTAFFKDSAVSILTL